MTDHNKKTFSSLRRLMKVQESMLCMDGLNYLLKKLQMSNNLINNKNRKFMFRFTINQLDEQQINNDGDMTIHMTVQTDYNLKLRYYQIYVNSNY